MKVRISATLPPYFSLLTFFLTYASLQNVISLQAGNLFKISLNLIFSGKALYDLEKNDACFINDANSFVALYLLTKIPKSTLLVMMELT